MSEANIELSLSESFAKHKRNLLFVSAIVMVLAAASPHKVKIPGLSTPTGIETVEGVPASIAYFFLLCTLAYFFLSYWIELLAVRARNLDGVASDGQGRVADRLILGVEPIAERHRQLITGMENITKHLEETSISLSELKFSETLKERSEKVESISSFLEAFPMPEDFSVASNFQSLRDQVIIVREETRGLNGLFEKFNATTYDISSSFTVAKDSFYITSGDVKERVDKLNGKLSKISSNISRSQRFGFTTLEQVVPIGLALCAFTLCFDGAFLKSAGSDWLRDKVPAIEQSQAEQNAMPKVGTQSTENR